MFPYLISIPILSEIAGTKEKKLRKMYAQIIDNDCVPLTAIPFDQQEKYAKEYLLRSQYVDIDLMQEATPDSDTPYLSDGVKKFFERTNVVRAALSIQAAYAADRTVTAKLTELAFRNGMSYRTLMRERSRFMKHTSLMNLLSDPNKGEDTVDRYRTCCFYCRDYIIARHESAGRPSDNSIFRETKNLTTFSCTRCPYHPDFKAKSHGKDVIIPAATCRRKSTHMITPNTRDTVNTIVNRIPKQETYMAWAGVRAWMSKCQHTMPRIKPEEVNFCWSPDNTLLDIIVKTKVYKDGSFDTGRVWVSGIVDVASGVLVGYALSTNPTSELIAHAFSTAAAFKPGSPIHGICKYWYCDNGKDFRAKLLKGQPADEQILVGINKEFCESGVLEWLGITQVFATKYNGRSKHIERVWRIIEDEFICKMQGYCGNKPSNRPATLEDDIKNGNLYTMEQFADIFAEVIFPGYNNFKSTEESESPMEKYLRLPKAKTIVPAWRTLAVLKKKQKPYAVHPDGIHYGKLDDKHPLVYWHPGLAQFIRPEKPYERVQVYAFDEPFNRSIAIVYGQVYIGEAHPVQGLNLIEERRYKVIQHMKEQELQLKTYSNHIKKTHRIVLQNKLIEKGTGIPAIDFVAYGQAIDEQRDKKEAVDDPRIPEELKELAIKYQSFDIEPEAPDMIGDFLVKLGQKE